MAKSIADILLDQFLVHKVDLLRVAESIREQILHQLELLQIELRNRLLDADLAGIKNLTTRLRKAEQLLRSVNQTINTAYRDPRKTLDSQLLDVAELESLNIIKIIGKVFHVEMFGTGLLPKELEVIASNIIINGSPANDWWAKQTRDLQLRFAQQVRMGILAGETNDDIVRRIIGTATGKRTVITVNGKQRILVERAGGIMSASKREATALVRTAVQAVSNKVAEETYRDNDDVLRGLQAIVTLDGRTSAICRGRAGAAWDFEGNPLPESPVKIPYPGPPPWHFGCRTFILPIVRSWDELSGMKGLGEIPPGTRASMDGQVAVGDMTYESWLKTKSEDFQRDVLGPGRFQLWKSGKVSLSEMIDFSGRSLTLEELRAKAK